MAKKAEGVKVVCTNKKARRDYHIEETVEAGLVLRGSEVKSLREGKANLTDAYARIEDGEAWISGLHISPYPHGRREEQDPDRDKKLLLHAYEIRRLHGKVRQKGYSLVPLRVYFRGGYAKVELGLGRGKKLYDKREDIKRADAKREMERAMRRR
ncbi:MAG: SsrA-binding protein SmpB [Candidatus Dadabacteria bacterium]|nr:MAG: SsrA-binding protein SmpB [Candidatus Dadabacteria bacterium]